MRFLLLVCALLAIEALTATATTYREHPAAVTSMTEVSGTVRRTVAERHGSRIRTRVTIDDDDGGTVDVIVPGGTLDGVTARVFGVPHLAVGARTRLTVKATARGLFLAGLGASP